MRLQYIFKKLPSRKVNSCFLSTKILPLSRYLFENNYFKLFARKILNLCIRWRSLSNRRYVISCTCWLTRNIVVRGRRLNASVLLTTNPAAVSHLYNPNKVVLVFLDIKSIKTRNNVHPLNFSFSLIIFFFADY